MRTTLAMSSPNRLLWLSLFTLVLIIYGLSHSPTISFATSSFVNVFQRAPRPKLLKHLPPQLVPTPENGRRLIIVGDIHGMLEPLDRLLERVHFDGERDHLVATGDMISKGPDSRGVVDRLIELKASAVRGNHEDHILKARWKMDKDKKKRRRKHHRKQGSEVVEEEDTDEDGKELNAREKMEIAKHKERDRKVAKSLSKRQVRWLNKLPVILSAEPLPIFIVHAGLVPGIEVKEQDPWAVMNMRTIVFPKNLATTTTTSELPPHDNNPQSFANLEPYDETSGNPQQQVLESKKEEEQETFTQAEYDALLTRGKHLIPDDGRDGKRWADVWNKYQHHKPQRKRMTVVYGHDAKRGHREGDYTFGLDSGCATGGKLTAVVITGKKGGWDHETVQVNCKAAKGQ